MAACSRLCCWQGNRENYFDPNNSFLDAVLDRKTGNPISLSLVFSEVGARVGCKFVGLNAPGHFLLAPDLPPEEPLSFCVDAFGSRNSLLFAGRNGVAGELEQAVASNTGRLMGNQLDPAAAIPLLTELRYNPMTPNSWAARILRNLRHIYSRQGDVVRFLGCVERLRALPDASPASEQQQCDLELAHCIISMRDEERRDEAVSLLQSLQRSRSQVESETAADVDSRAFVEAVNSLLENPWLS